MLDLAIKPATVSHINNETGVHKMKIENIKTDSSGNTWAEISGVTFGVAAGCFRLMDCDGIAMRDITTAEGELAFGFACMLRRLAEQEWYIEGWPLKDAMEYVFAENNHVNWFMDYYFNLTDNDIDINFLLNLQHDIIDSEERD